MPLLNYTTKIDPHTTVGEIQKILVKHGAKRIMIEYGDNEHIDALTFSIDTPAGSRFFRLPANSAAVQKVLTKQKVKCDEAQAERVAWRIVKDWVECQMAILESAMVDLEQIFLPYMVNNNGKTVYEIYRNNQLMLDGE